MQEGDTAGQRTARKDNMIKLWAEAFMKKYLWIILLVIAVIILKALFAFGIALVFRLDAKIEVYDDLSQYESYLAGADRDGKGKWNKWGMDESIWPRKITETMNVRDFKMVYYNPWDAQYLGYLVVDYSPEEYAEEADRLRNYPSTEYKGYYGVEEEKTHELLAVNADPYNGFVYALTDGKSRIIYAEEIFCNYFMDLDYLKYIPEDYLLDGFDARTDNPYRKKMMHE